MKRFNDISILDINLRDLIRNLENKCYPPNSYIVTPNIDHFSRLEESHTEFFAAYKHATIRVCDSRIVKILSIFEEKKIKNVVPGSDLTKEVLSHPVLSKKRILLVGPSAEDAVRISEKYSLTQANWLTPPMHFIKSQDEVHKCLDQIKAANPELIFLAVGSPQQEILAKRIQEESINRKSQIEMIFCIGASLDFLSERSTRAPRWMQSAHLEWLHRMLGQPRRLVPRYFKNALWIFNYILKNLGSTRP